MNHITTRTWGELLLRGLINVLFGVLAFIWPKITILVLVLLFGAYALIEGVMAFIEALRRRYEHWQFVMFGGIISIIIGILILFWPEITALILVYLIAVRAIIMGIMEFIAAARMPQAIRGKWLLSLGGIIAVTFGLIIFIRPAAGIIAIIWLIALYLTLFGLLNITAAIMLRKVIKEAY
jgi:uncharacterized membrane protein HdeD (DUF308 family)